jgi:hypothetical protein
MKGRKHRGTGGVNEAESDLKDKPEARTNAGKIDKEAEERKHGGRAKRKHGGMAVHGEKHGHHAGRKPRKSGGRTGSDSNPLTSSHTGKQPPGRSVMADSMD